MAQVLLTQVPRWIQAGLRKAYPGGR